MKTLMPMTKTTETSETTKTFELLLRGRSQLRRKARETLPASGSTSTPSPRGAASTGRSLGPPTRQAGACCSSGTSARTGRPACRGRCLRFPLAKSGTTFAVEREKKGGAFWLEGGQKGQQSFSRDCKKRKRKAIEREKERKGWVGGGGGEK